jgi:hypothetical protein
MLGTKVSKAPNTWRHGWSLPSGNRRGPWRASGSRRRFHTVRGAQARACGIGQAVRWQRAPVRSDLGLHSWCLRAPARRRVKAVVTGIYPLVADLFEHKPEVCPYGHQLGPGRIGVSWTPCICEPAKEADSRGRGMGHIRLDCRECEAEGRVTVFYEPPHDPAQPHIRLLRLGRSLQWLAAREPVGEIGGVAWLGPIGPG